MEPSVEIVKTGSRLHEIGAQAFMDFINPFIEEKALIKMQEKVTLEQEEKWLKDTAEELDKGAKIFVLALSGKRIVGDCQAYTGKRTESRNLTFGLAISKDFRGQGLGRKLLLAGIEEGRKVFSPHKIMISYIEGNEPARKLYESVGFREVCRLKDHHYHYGQFRDSVMLELKDVK